MIKTTLPIALCVSLVSSFSANASDEHKELKQRVKFLESREELARGELDAIKQHPLYEQILRDIIKKQVGDDYDDVRSTKIQSLESLPRDVLYLILARSGNLHAVRETSSKLNERVQVIKSVYGLPCLHDGKVGDDTPSAPAFNFAISPSVEAAQQALHLIYTNEIREAQQEQIRQANELKARQLQQARLDEAHRTRIVREAAEKERQDKKAAEEKARNERIAAKKAKDAELSRMAEEERQRQLADKAAREARAEAKRQQEEQERLAREAQLRAQEEQERLVRQQQEQERIARQQEENERWRREEQRRQDEQRERQRQNQNQNNYRAAASR